MNNEGTGASDEDSPTSILIDPSFSTVTHFSEYGIYLRDRVGSGYHRSHKISLSNSFLDDGLSPGGSFRDRMRRNSVWLSGVGFLRSRGDRAASTSSRGSVNECVPDLSFNSTYDEEMVSRAESILHFALAVFKNVFIRNHYSISRHQILCVNGFFYVPEVDVATTPTGIVKQARRLVKRYGVYSLDTEAAPVIVEFLSKTCVSEAFQFEEKDYLLSLRIQSDLNNQRNNPHVIQLYHLLETEQYLISVTEVINGSISNYAEWIRTNHLVRPVFSQIVRAYGYLYKLGYYHCNLSLDVVMLQVQPNQQNPQTPLLVVKIAGFEYAIPFSQGNRMQISDGSIHGSPSYMAPECFEESYKSSRVDIWSLGVILFCLLTGEVPFDIANSSDEAFFLFQGKGFDFLRESLHEVKAEPGAICLLEKMLVEDPSKRISYRELSNDFYVQY